MLMKGVGRAHDDTPQRRIGERRQRRPARARVPGALEVEAGDHRLAPVAHEVVLERQPPARRAHGGAYRRVAGRHDPRAHPEAAGHVLGDVRQRFAGCEAAAALDVQGEVAVAEPEPALSAESGQCLHERPGLAATPPAGLGVGEPGQRVEDGVRVGTDAQPQVVEVVARVADHGERIGRQHAVQAERELCAPDATGQRHHRADVHR